ncbi:MAG: MFS transporter [Alphaproteobacteria bacterium]|nr:MFS transporter [Alphaproteobacteria bacterium]
MQNTAATPSLKKTINIILGTSLGNALEFYELTVFGFLSTLFVDILSTSYAQIDLVMAYGVFAVGFFFRPLGAIIFGYIGDKHGRKKALCGSILMMGAATFFMGCIPFSEPMWVSLALLILLRIIQGISTGGELAGAVVFAVENTSAKHRGLITTLVASSGMIGVIMGGLVGKYILNGDNALWSWRYAFWVGVIMSLLALWMRRRFDDAFEHKGADEKEPFRFMDAFSGDNKLPLLSAVLMSGVAGMLIYIKSVFLSGIEGKGGMYSIGSSMMILLIPPIFGYFSDFIGRKRIMLSGVVCLLSVGFVAVSQPELMRTHTILMLALFGVSASMYLGAMHTIMFESFKQEHRYTGIGIGYSLGMGVIGGSTPMVAQHLMQGEHGFQKIFLYFASLCIFAVGSVYYRVSKERAHKLSLAAKV